MMLNKNKLAALVLGTAIFGATGTVQAQTYEHIDRLALRLARQTAEMHDEVHAHFRNTPDYRHLDHDVAEMERLARHIHDVAHHRGSLAHLRADVEELDRNFHHIEDIIERLARTRQIGFRTLSHFRETMAAIDDTLHHLRDDLAQMRVHYHQQMYRPQPVQQYRPQPVPSHLQLPFGIRVRF